MEVEEKIGIAIITCNRPDYLKKLLLSLPTRENLELIIINDGNKIDIDNKKYNIHNNETNLGVAKSKNIGLRHLLNLGCEHIFLIEDDMFIKDCTVFEKYIEASKISGIQHFNYSQHGLANKCSYEGGFTPLPRAVVNYNKNVTLSFYRHCVGSFSYYSRKCLMESGLMDERYYNACEHVDHTYEIIKKGFHPPFWWFADLDKSWEYIGDDGWSIETSTICSKTDFRDNVKRSDKTFVEKHGCLPSQIPNIGINEAYKEIKKIKNDHTPQIPNISINKAYKNNE